MCFVAVIPITDQIQFAYGGGAVDLTDVSPAPDSDGNIIIELTGQIASEKLIENVPTVVGYGKYRELGNRAVEDNEMRGASAYLRRDADSGPLF